jgi:hypothetical protein
MSPSVTYWFLVIAGKLEAMLDWNLCTSQAGMSQAPPIFVMRVQLASHTAAASGSVITTSAHAAGVHATSGAHAAAGAHAAGVHATTGAHAAALMRIWITT